MQVSTSDLFFERPALELSLAVETGASARLWGLLRSAMRKILTLAFMGTMQRLLTYLVGYDSVVDGGRVVNSAALFYFSARNVSAPHIAL